MTHDYGATSPTTDARLAFLETQVAQLSQRVTTLEAAAREPAVETTSAWDAPPWPEILGLLRDGNKIAAIKVYREHFRVGLAEAKDAIENIR